MSQLDPHKKPENKIPAIRMLREEVRHLESNEHLPLFELWEVGQLMGGN